ncbi:hypothetical protein MtrunA17_Chr5g0399971 [Medicago truncatula]|uniref:Transmembrane protein n=1 Tax=Medicago truncatula TaxID=3880 RepID=A0A396HSW9_MEDTR|nr:hypothetical protein MtrunA17_Chr5g0399971 [Medicago truncatula]
MEWMLAKLQQICLHIMSNVLGHPSISWLLSTTWVYFLRSRRESEQLEVTMQPRKDTCSMKSLLLINFCYVAHSGRSIVTVSSIEGGNRIHCTLSDDYAVRMQQF